MAKNAPKHFISCKKWQRKAVNLNTQEAGTKTGLTVLLETKLKWSLWVKLINGHVSQLVLVLWVPLTSASSPAAIMCSLSKAPPAAINRPRPVPEQNPPLWTCENVSHLTARAGSVFVCFILACQRDDEALLAGGSRRGHVFNRPPCCPLLRRVRTESRYNDVTVTTMTCLYRQVSLTFFRRIPCETQIESAIHHRVYFSVSTGRRNMYLLILLASLAS